MSTLQIVKHLLCKILRHSWYPIPFYACRGPIILYRCSRCNYWHTSNKVLDIMEYSMWKAQKEYNDYVNACLYSETETN
jgi:hypothetical protein